MPYDSQPSPNPERDRLHDWHPHFAWLPVKLPSGETRWLTRVERRGTHYAGIGADWWEWEYRDVPKA